MTRNPYFQTAFKLCFSKIYFMHKERLPQEPPLEFYLKLYVAYAAYLLIASYTCSDSFPIAVTSTGFDKSKLKIPIIDFPSTVVLFDLMSISAEKLLTMSRNSSIALIDLKRIFIFPS